MRAYAQGLPPRLPTFEEPLGRLDLRARRPGMPKGRRAVLDSIRARLSRIRRGAHAVGDDLMHTSARMPAPCLHTCLHTCLHRVPAYTLAHMPTHMSTLMLIHMSYSFMAIPYTQMPTRATTDENAPPGGTRTVNELCMHMPMHPPTLPSAVNSQRSLQLSAYQ